MVTEKGITKVNLVFFPLVKKMLVAFCSFASLAAFPVVFSDGEYLIVFFFFILANAIKGNSKREGNLKIMLLLEIDKPTGSHCLNNDSPVPLEV